MHFSIIVLCVTLLNHTVVSVSVEKLRGKYMKNDKTDYYQITVPRKISDDGEFVTHYLPHFYDISRPKRHLQGESVNYLITIDNNDHHVQLWPSMDFIAPGIVVEHHAENVKDNLSNIAIRQIRSRRCYFNGVVRGEPYSRAVLSTCDGLSGTIRTGAGEQYLIEPVHEDDQPTMDDKQLHLIYKRSLLEQVNNHTNCGTKGTSKESINDRLKWESKYGKAVEDSVRSLVNDHFLYSRENNRPLLDYKLELSRKSRRCPTCLETSTPLCVCPPTDPLCLASTPLFLEMMVTIDYRVDRTWAGVDVETYVFSILNVVASHLADGSIGNPIKLNVVRVILLTYAYPQLDILRYSPMKLLNNFCEWQMNFNPNNEYHPNHHDFAVFITRFEPCQGHVLGVTNMASICRPDKSCAVVSDEGLLLANIITHQIGHSLGADHDDGSSGGCAAEEPDGTMYHMGPMMSMSSSEWSVCSKHCISDFVSTHVSWCLADLPSQHDFTKPNILPGQIYSPIQQCSINFNLKTMACRIGEFCKMLYCQISPTQCASTGDPPAAGTPCAMNMWCFHGDCVQRGARPGAVNGEWGPWSAWSLCTRTCGGGVQVRYRSCNDPAPLQGGRNCKGEYISFRMCSILPCVGFSQAFAQLQCKLTDSRLFRGRLYSWDLFPSFFEDVKCALICINEKKHIAVRSAVVVDGTPCKPGTRDVCVQGKCMHVGCDWVINSKSKEDACGVCHGNGTECRIVQGFYNEGNISKNCLHAFLKLPTGSSMIYIRELSPSKCILVITSSINGTYYLNNLRGEETLPGVVNIAGSIGVYETRQMMERLYVQERIHGPVTINLLCKENYSKGIRYQYALPEADKFYIPRYTWEYLYWEECDAPCGGGAQRAQAVCIEARSGEVDDKYCGSIIKPDDVIRPCNQFPCIARWWVGPWSDCDCTDTEGIQTRLVLCIRSFGFDTTKAKVVKERECCRQPKPRVERPCSPTAELEYDQTTKDRMKREMARMQPYDPNEEDSITEPVLKTDLYLDGTQSPLVTADFNNNENSGFLNPDISENKANDENALLNFEDYDADFEQPLNKAFDRNIQENFEKRRRKLFPNSRARLRSNVPQLNLNELLRDPYIQRRPVHRPRFYNAMMEMANRLNRENQGLVRNSIEKGGGLIPFHDTGNIHHAPFVSKMSNKLLHPTIRANKQQAPSLTNNTLLVLRPIGVPTNPPTKADDNNQPITENSAKVSVTTALAPTTAVAETTTCVENVSVATTAEITSVMTSHSTEITTWCPQKIITPLDFDKTTTCNVHQSSQYEPADLPGWLETANASSYKLILTPIDQMRYGFPETDSEFELLGRSGSWPSGDLKNQITIYGEQVLQALLEGKRRVTKPPYIDTDGS